MARLIDADALMEEINTQRRASIGSYPRRYYVVGDTLNSIRNAPTVDAVEVVHGWWIEKHEPIPWCEDDVDVYTVCSVCDSYSPGESNYCPNCGAKMDK